MIENMYDRKCILLVQLNQGVEYFEHFRERKEYDEAINPTLLLVLFRQCQIFFGCNIKQNVFSHLSVVQFKSGVVVVAVAVHPLVHYCYVAIDLLSTFLQRPVLPTLSPTAFVGPATEGQDVFDKINTDSTSKNQNRYF